MNITAAKYCKQQGIKNLTVLSEESGVPKRTLYHWFDTKFKLFELVVLGYKSKCGN